MSSQGSASVSQGVTGQASENGLLTYFLGKQDDEQGHLIVSLGPSEPSVSVKSSQLLLEVVGGPGCLTASWDSMRMGEAI